MITRTQFVLALSLALANVPIRFIDVSCHRTTTPQLALARQTRIHFGLELIGPVTPDAQGSVLGTVPVVVGIDRRPVGAGYTHLL